MKKPTLKTMLMVLLVVLTVFTFTSCEELLAIFIEGLFTTVDGTVVNAKADGDETEYWKSGDETLSGATISLYSYDESTGQFDSSADYSATVGSTGNYSIAEVLVGKYKIEGQHDGWTFVPRVVDVAGEDVNLPQILAYPSGEEYTATILVSWEDTDLDLDSYLSYYDGTSTRGQIYYSNTSYSNGSTTYLNLDRDVTASTDESIPRVETITLVEPEGTSATPFFSSNGETDGIADNQLRYYVKCYNNSDSQSLTGLDDSDSSKKSAFAQVDVMYQGASTEDAIHMGSWELPWNTDENLLHVVNFNALEQDGYGYYQITSAGYETSVRSISAE